MPKHSLGLGATTCPGSGVGKAGEKQIELINTPWLPPTPSWGKSTIYELTVLTQGEASQQCSSVCIASGFSFLTTGQLHGRPRGTSGLVGGARPWKQRGPGSDSSSVTLCPSMLFILYFSGHWALGLICLFPVDRGGKIESISAKLLQALTLLESNHLQQARISPGKNPTGRQLSYLLEG